MRHTLYAGLGAKGVRLSSGDAANAINVKYSARVVEAAAEHSAVATRITCLSGAHAIRTPVAHDASGRLASASVGTIIEGSSTAPPNAFQSRIPSTCEVDFRYQIRGPIVLGEDAEPPTPTALGTVCLADGVLHQRACSDTELPRVAASTPIEITGIDARIGKTSGDSFGIALSVLVTAGADPPPAWRIWAKTQCQTADGGAELEIPLLLIDRDLRPGESVVGIAGTPSQSGLPHVPSRCTLALHLGIEETSAKLATYCVEQDGISAGPCAP